MATRSSHQNKQAKRKKSGKMGKHRNPEQDKIFIEFMESHQDIARGYIKGDRVVSESCWSDLTNLLNSSGPPSKDCNGWKKTWADWKCFVKKKMWHNKKETRKTGGGQYNQYVLSDIEETLARICGIHKNVEGVAGAKTFGDVDINLYLSDSDKENEDLDVTTSTSKTNKTNELDVTASTSKSAKTNELNCTASTSKSAKTATKVIPSQSPPPKRKMSRPSTPHTPLKPNLNSLLAEENNNLKNIVNILEQQRVDQKLEKVIQVLEEQRDEMKFQNQKLDRLCDILEKSYNAKQLNDMEVQKKLCEKNEFKLKLLEIETLKLEIKRQNPKKH